MKIKCKVCKTRVVPQRESTVDVRKMLFSKPLYCDVMDCPKCGCQIALGIRETGVVHADEKGKVEE